MSIVNVKLRQREKNKYRKMVSTDETIYENASTIINSSVPYAAGATLEEGEWFYIENAKGQPYALEVFDHNFETVDFDSLDRKDFGRIDFLFTNVGENIFFQNISKSRLISKKSIICFGENYEYKNNQQEIVVNDLPDAIFVPDENRLYFRRLESITSIFKGIDQLYREATDEEVTAFLGNDFISLQNDYSTINVKTANRKRIALAKKTLDALSKEDREKIFTYIGEYCPDLKTDEDAFEVGSEDEMKLLLFGIEQRFYTTPVGGEKRLANSVILLNTNAE